MFISKIITLCMFALWFVQMHGKNFVFYPPLLQSNHRCYKLFRLSFFLSPMYFLLLNGVQHLIKLWGLDYKPIDRVSDRSVCHYVNDSHSIHPCVEHFSTFSAKKISSFSCRLVIPRILQRICISQTLKGTWPLIFLFNQWYEVPSCSAIKPSFKPLWAMRSLSNDVFVIISPSFYVRFSLKNFQHSA